MQPNDVQKLEQQVKVSRMLANGFAFSLVALGGIGSLFALIIGLRAWKIIKQSKGEISGIVMAWWCIIVGALGVLTIPPFIIYLVLQNIK